MAARNLKLVIAYDGSAYVGWERQDNGLAVQEVLERALARIVGLSVEVHGSGRTDSGVHALGQVASVQIDDPIHPRKLKLALNALTPADIAVLDVCEVDAGFHARKSAVSKCYRYTILNDEAPRPLMRHAVFHYPQPLDAGLMGRAAADLVGTHDFRAFAKEAWRRKSCVRTLLDARVSRVGPLLHVEVEGTGFLYNMVRIIAGTLIEIGRGRRPPDGIRVLLSGASRRDAGFTAPAHGLALVEVRYGGSPAAFDAEGGSPRPLGGC